MAGVEHSMHTATTQPYRVTNNKGSFQFSVLKLTPGELSLQVNSTSIELDRKVSKLLVNSSLVEAHLQGKSLQL